MHKIRAPFNVSTAGQQAAIQSLKAMDFVEASRVHNEMWRAWIVEQIGSLGNAGLRAVPSKANFVLVLFEGRVTAEEAYTGLMERGYIVRWLPGQGLRHGLRISIGTEEQTQGMMAALREIVAG
jgi:histidinol-phosphate aminotransferase